MSLTLASNAKVHLLQLAHQALRLWAGVVAIEMIAHRRQEVGHCGERSEPLREAGDLAGVSCGLGGSLDALLVGACQRGFECGQLVPEPLLGTLGIRALAQPGSLGLAPRQAGQVEVGRERRQHRFLKRDEFVLAHDNRLEEGGAA